MLASWDALEDQANAEELKAGGMQTNKYVVKAAASLGIDLSPES
ncbi:MAG: hypothetical protein ACI9QV_000698 [Methylophagaceae bacterium]